MSGKSDYGKGDSYRPVNRKKYEENWERIFKKNKAKKSKGNSKPKYLSAKELSRLARQHLKPIARKIEIIDVWQETGRPHTFWVSFVWKDSRVEDAQEVAI